MAALFQQAIIGMNLSTLSSFLWRQRRYLHWRYFHRLALLVVTAAWNSYLSLFEEAFNAEAIATAKLIAPPIFIIGYFRSGTSHLHNLLNCDPTFTCPTAYQITFPHHFIYSQPWGAKIFNYLTPGKRPMDNVSYYADSPDEEEKALAALSGVSPFFRILLPTVDQDDYLTLDPGQLPTEALAAWQEAFWLFLRKLSFSKNKRIVLKSPLHLGRIPILVKMFPGAKFVHITRNPYLVYLSFLKNWRYGHALSHLQKPDPLVIDELILSWYVDLFSLFERDRGLIPAGNLHELHFEDLERSPRDCLKKLYEDLNLPDFERFWQQASVYLESIESYQKNRYSLTEEVRAKVSQRWRFFFERYGYPLMSPFDPSSFIPLG